MHRKVGKKKPHYKHRKPSFYLVSAVQINSQWQLPLPVETLLAWLWQRWELEVAHREMKSGFGVGKKQCWNPCSTIASVQWGVWVYALLLLSAYRAWGLLNAPPIPTRWWRDAQRWLFNTLWRQYRSAFWGTTQFQALWTRTPDNWLISSPWGKKNPSSLLYPIPLPLLLAFNTKWALSYPFCFCLLFQTFLKQPKSRGFV
jgi:hypothetical protein